MNSCLGQRDRMQPNQKYLAESRRPPGPAGLWALLAVVSLLAAGTLGAQPLDDRFTGLEGQPIEIAAADLLHNDGVAAGGKNGETWWPELTRGPGSGTLSWSADGSALVYEGHLYGSLPFAGTDTFSYRLTGAGAPPGEAVVTVELRPLWTPILGRWTAQGGGAELGLWNADSALFRLCSVVGEALRQCDELPVSAEHRLWAPLSADLSGDGVHELLLHDAGSGQLVVFELTERCAEPGRRCLRELERRAFGQPGQVAVAGTTLDGSSRLGLFDPASGAWWLEGQAASETVPAWVFDPSARHAVPLLGDWYDTGELTVAVYDPEVRRMYLRVEAQTGQWQTFDPTAYASFGEVVATAGFMPTAVCSNKLLLLDRRTGLIHTFAVGRCGAGQVYITVPTDPSGGGDHPIE